MIFQEIGWLFARNSRKVRIFAFFDVDFAIFLCDFSLFFAKIRLAAGDKVFSQNEGKNHAKITQNPSKSCKNVTFGSDFGHPISQKNGEKVYFSGLFAKIVKNDVKI